MKSEMVVLNELDGCKMEMVKTKWYKSPIGRILMAADEKGICGLWWEGQKHFAKGLPDNTEEGESEFLDQAVEWLDRYFQGKDPGFVVPVHLKGTPFQLEVWNQLAKVPFGSTTTYKEIAQRIENQRHAKTSALAVGNAIGKNPVSILVGCHRILGSDGSLKGYVGGLDKKEYLLNLEKDADGKQDQDRSN